MSRNYKVHESVICEPGELRDWEFRNCSITEILLEEKGPGVFTRIGDWEHILDALDTLYTKERLENSTGQSL